MTSSLQRRPNLAFRQVHLDFHTHGSIPDVGRKFDKRQFQEALKTGRVNSITLFSKCHHGWSYHETRVGRKHPNLQGELLPRQIEACREIGVRCPIYISAGFDELRAASRPEWMVKDRAGESSPPEGKPGYRRMRFNSPYLDYLCAQIEEVVRRWPDGDGIFLDIVAPQRDFSTETLEELEGRGMDPEKADDLRAYSLEVLKAYYERTTAAVRSKSGEMPLFHNAGHISVGSLDFIRFNSHLELESLPTGGWGYDHFPLSAAYAHTLGYEFLGMTGKFHTTWGEFGGFKRPEALRYECDAMLAHGARCSIGDQLHPSGEMNRDTYSLIGHAFKDVERKEPWCTAVRPLAQIGLVSAIRDQHIPRSHNEPCHADEGAARMLLESHHPFLLLDQGADWGDFALIILPDHVQLTPEMLKRAQKYLANGGKILASGTSLFDTEQKDFVLEVGAKLTGRSGFDPNYLVATEACRTVPVRSPIVIHGEAWDVEPTGAAVFAARAVPYFNRTAKHFCSHQHAPEAALGESPAAISNGRIVYFAHEIFRRYRLYGQPLYRDFVTAAIDLLLNGERLVETSLPTTGRATLIEQPEHNRYVLHLLHAAPILRGSSHGPMARPVELIEEVLPLHNINIRLRLPRPIAGARLVPEEEDLPVSQVSGIIEFTVPRVEGHQMVALECRP